MTGAEVQHNRGVLGTIFSQHIKMTSRFHCKDCDVTCSKPIDWQRHIETNKHLRAQQNVPKIPRKFVCEDCDYECCKNSILERHKTSMRHKLKVKSNISERMLDISSADRGEIVTKPSHNHCDQKSAIIPNDYMAVISQLLNQNNELKNFIIEQSTEYKNFIAEQASEHKKETSEIVNKVLEQTNKVLDTVKPINNTINGNVSNNQTNKFNINVFLNEQCKNAMNLSDFIKNIEVSREDLENNAQLGFVGGISKIFLDNLRQLSINERPIHCTDLKRETMYIKDDDKWTKETGPAKLNTVIQTITQKSTRTLLDWKKVNPDYNDHDSEFSTRCIVIQRNSMAGHDRDTYYPKVIKVIAKEVTI